MIINRIQEFYGPDSPLKGDTGNFHYEHRPQQVAMAEAIADAFDRNQNLCVEAPTGVGKTFAYLVPAIFQAAQKAKPVIISTHTIHLQEQILQQDVPFLEKLTGRTINAVVAKGRANYLCLRKLGEVADLEADLLPGAQALDDIAKLATWAEKTTTGDRTELTDEISGAIWNAVASERGNCLNAKCPFFSSCFLMKARIRVAKAQLVITNHAFFFSAMALQDSQQDDDSQDRQDARDLLPEPAAIIIDEAHTIEDNAASHLALKAESFVINKLINRLYNPEQKRGLLEDPAFISIQDTILDTKHKAAIFFTQILQWLEPQRKNPLRYTVPNHIPDYLREPIQEVLGKLDAIIARLDQEQAALKTELTGIQQALAEQQEAMTTFFSMGLPDCVYWMETSGREQQNIAFCTVPVNVAPILQEKLFTHPPVILTSATLAVDGALRFFLQRIGAENAQQLILGTPFDYQNQVRLYVANQLPDPKSPDYLELSIPYLKKYLAQTKGHAFVLFTSYKCLNETADKLETFCKLNHYNLIRQGTGMSSRSMIRQFKKSQNAIIFGTSSFWTGVDVPGEALSNVIITKLPFAVPDHPLIAARAERTRTLGGNDFRDYSIPEAVLKFRQGFGRLIRSKTDRGIVVILDSRVATKYYGRIFLKSIPECPIEYI